MNFYFRLPWTKPEPVSDVPARGISGRFTEAPATRIRRGRFTDRCTELAIYNATTSLEQRRAETEAYFAKARGQSSSNISLVEAIEMTRVRG